MWRKKTFILTYFPLCGGDLRLRCDCYCYGMDFFICSFILSLFMSFCLFFLSTSVSCCFFSEVLIKVFQQHLHFIFMSQIQRNILCTFHRSIQHPLVSYTEKKNHFCLFHKVAIWQKTSLFSWAKCPLKNKGLHNKGMVRKVSPQVCYTSISLHIHRPCARHDTLLVYTLGVL